MSAITPIAYAAKSNITAIVNRPNQAVAEDFNEIKSVVNACVAALNTLTDNGAEYTPEDKDNKVASVSAASTDVQYPSAKLFYDALVNLQNQILPPSQILLSASADVATRISGGATIPDGWSVAADSTVNLVITHTLTGRKIAFVNVFEIDGADERLVKPFEDAYSGILANGLTIKLEGLDTLALPLRIELIFD